MATTELEIVIRLLDSQGTLGQFQAAFGSFNRGVSGASGQVGQMNQRLEQTNTLFHFIRRSMEFFLLYRGFSALAHGTSAFVGELVKLERQVRLVQTQLGGGPDQKPLITREILEVARSTGVGLQELAKTQYNIVSANIALADSFKALDLSARAAAAGGIDDSTVAFNAALTEMNAFGIGIAGLEAVYDRQFQLIRRGIFTYAQFAGVVGTVSTEFARMGQDLETTHAAVAATSLVFTGPQLERGATGLRNMAEKIGANRDEFEKLGVSVITTQGEFRNFIDIMEDLKRALAPLSEAERFSALEKLFVEDRAIRGAQALLGLTEEMRTFYTEQKFASGDLARASDEVTKSISDQASMIGKSIAGAYQPFVMVLGDLVRAMNFLVQLSPAFSAAMFTAAGALVTAGAAHMAIKSPVLLGSLKLTGPQARAAVPSSFPVGAMAFNAATAPAVTGPTRLGRTVGYGAGFALPALLAEEQARRTQEKGLGWGEVLSGGLSGAAMGAVVGAPLAGIGAGMGAAAGGGAGVLFALLGEALEAEAEPLAKSFSEALAEALKDRSRTIAEALISITTEEMGGRIVTRKMMEGGPFSYPKEASTEDITKLLTDTNILDIFGEVRALQKRKSEYEMQLPSIEEAAITAAREYQTTIEEVRKGRRDYLTSKGNLVRVTEADVGTLILPEAVDRAIGIPANAEEKSIPVEIREFRSIVRAVLQETTDEARIRAGFANVRSYGVPEGPSLPPSPIREMTPVSPAPVPSTPLLPQDISFPEPPNVTRPSTAAELLAALPSVREPKRDLVPEYVAAPRSTTSIAPFEEIPTTDFLREFSQGVSPPAFGLGGPLTELPGSSFLETALEDVAEAIESGLLPSSILAGDSLTQFSTSIDMMNDAIYRVRIIEELIRIGEVAGETSATLDKLREKLLPQVRNAAKAFDDLFSDEKKIEDFANALVEVGDVKVDRSTNNNIVIRISGGTDMDPAKAAAFADAVLPHITAGLNRQQREAKSG